VVESTESEFLANIRRISELGFDSIRIRFGRIRISVSEFDFEFGELYTLFQNSDSPNIREYEFEIWRLFPHPWLRLLDELDFNRLNRKYSHLGFPGAIGCIDVASRYWDLCCMAWQGQCKCKDGSPNVHMEVICDDF
jgi:hypothetical protein